MMCGNNTDEIVRAYELAADAAAERGRDATATSRYNRGRMAEAAEMAVLREFDERAVWGEVCETIDAVGRPGANAPRFRGRVIEDVLRRVAAELRTTAEPETLTDGGETVETWEDLAEDLECNERVEVSYRDPEDGSLTMTEGTVCKSNRGGMRILPDGGRRLLVVKRGWRVTSVHPDGGSTRHRSVVGEEGTVVRTGETGGVEYRDNAGGWRHVDE